jgi:hypothetical protein
MIFKDIVTKRTYTKRDGTEGVVWNKVGKIRLSDDGSKGFMELFHLPGVEYHVFEEKVQPDPLRNPTGAVKPQPSVEDEWNAIGPKEEF